MKSFGIDPVHFGIVMLLNLGIGLLTPPVGTTLFVGCAIGKVSVDEVMRGIWPFYYVMFTVLMIVTYVPWLSLALPRAFGFSNSTHNSAGRGDFCVKIVDLCAASSITVRRAIPATRPSCMASGRPAENPRRVR